MKKTLFLSIVALACVFVGCNKETSKKDEVKVLTGITVNPTAIGIEPYDTVRLSAILEPSGASAVITWESSDEAVVECLTNGVIVGKDYGEATVTAKAGDFSAECQVVVAESYDLWSVYDISVVGSSKSKIAGSDTTILYRDSKYKGYLCDMELFMYDANVEGDGGYATFIPVRIFSDSTYVYVNNATFELGDSVYTEFGEDGVIRYHCLRGSFVDTTAYVNALLSILRATEDITKDQWAAYDETLSGGKMLSAQITDEGISYSYLTHGLVTAGNVDNMKGTYSIDVDWIFTTDWETGNPYYGLETEMVTDSTFDFTGKLGEVVSRTYTNASSKQNVGPKAVRLNSSKATDKFAPLAGKERVAVSKMR